MAKPEMTAVIRYVLHCGLIQNEQLYYIAVTLFTHGINMCHTNSCVSRATAVEMNIN